MPVFTCVEDTRSLLHSLNKGIISLERKAVTAEPLLITLAHQPRLSFAV